MKKVFFVKRLSKIDWDEYDSCVIVADSIDEVNYMIDNYKYNVSNDSFSYNDRGINDREITEIDLKNCESQLICSSFNAG